MIFWSRWCEKCARLFRKKTSHLVLGEAWQHDTSHSDIDKNGKHPGRASRGLLWRFCCRSWWRTRRSSRDPVRGAGESIRRLTFKSPLDVFPPSRGAALLYLARFISLYLSICSTCIQPLKSRKWIILAQNQLLSSYLSSWEIVCRLIVMNIDKSSICI